MLSDEKPVSMKIDFTSEEADELIRLTESPEVIARIVDPVSQHVCMQSGSYPEGIDFCCSIWGRQERCENCTSLKAYRIHGTAFKMELIGDRMYWVKSRYLRLDGKPCILEEVNDVSDDLLLDSDQRSQMSSIINSFNHQLIMDPLMGIYNRRYLDDYFLPSATLRHGEGQSVNIAVIDLDHFKKVNDTFGHQAGDMLLKDVAGFWKRRFNSRVNGHERLAIRYGGDELLLVGCGIALDAFATEVRQSYAEMRKTCYCPGGVRVPFSISFGIAGSDELGDGWTWEALFDSADKRLYEAKKKVSPQ